MVRASRARPPNLVPAVGCLFFPQMEDSVAPSRPLAKCLPGKGFGTPEKTWVGREGEAQGTNRRNRNHEF